MRTTRNWALPACGIAMPVIYCLTLIIAGALNPGFDPLRREPSELGRADAVYPLVYNAGLVASAAAGLLAGAFLIGSRRGARGRVWTICAGATICLASAGLAMAGLFPLPNPLHYGFGLTMAAVLAPVFGAASLAGSGRRLAAVPLLMALVLIAGLIVAGAPSLLPGALMLVSIGHLCCAVNPRGRRERFSTV